ncbi:hypothetical protein ACOTCG_04775 [Achromobacter xylosoxidans]
MNRPLLSRLLSSRPVAKGLRMLYRHTRPPARRHNAVLWPFVRVQRDPAGRLGPDVFEKRHWHCLLPPGTATGTFAESD